MLMKKKMFKVLSPVEKKGGGTLWLRLGTAFTNKDESINLYLDGLPTNGQLHLREMTEEDFASSRRDDAPPRAGASASASADAVPF